MIFTSIFTLRFGRGGERRGGILCPPLPPQQCHFKPPSPGINYKDQVNIFASIFIVKMSLLLLYYRSFKKYMLLKYYV